MRSAQCFLDSGYTMAFGAASAKKRLDIVIRNAINAGDIPGPRYLANGKEMCRRGGDLVASISAFADGPEEMREVIREHIALGVDNIKLSMSGEEVWLSFFRLLDCIDCVFFSRSLKPGQRRIATSPMKKRLPASTRYTSEVNGFAHMPGRGTR